MSSGVYNSFVQMNISTMQSLPEDRIARLMRLIGQSSRIRILLAIGKREVCVCHLETVLNQRQAFISQHLKQLREAGFVITERKSRHIYYRLSDPNLINLIRSTAALTGNPDWIDSALTNRPIPNCPCPECSSTSICPREVNVSVPFSEPIA